MLHQYVDVNVRGWDSDDTLHFVLPKTTGNGELNVSVGVRRTSSYRYESLRLLNMMYCDDELLRSDTIVFRVYDESGRNIDENMVYYTITEYIPVIPVDSGHVYSFHINHLMQEESIRGIKNIGLEVRE